MTNPPAKLYYLGSLITEETALELSDDFKLPFRVVTETLLRVSLGSGYDPTHGHSGITLTRVKALVEALGTETPESDSDASLIATAEQEKAMLFHDEREELHIDDVTIEDPIAFAAQLKAAGMTGGPVFTDHHGVFVEPPAHVESTNCGENPDVDEADFVNIPEEILSREEDGLSAPLHDVDAEEEESFEPEDTEADTIVTEAASSLMSAFSDPEGFFLITPDGCCAINPLNPPNIEQAHIAVAHALKLKDLGGVIEDRSSWMIGSLVAAMEDMHGENFSITQICEASNHNYNTTAQAVAVFRAFPTRFKVSYSHHQEAHYAKIQKTKLRPDPLQTKKLILKKAESHKLGAKQVRALCSIAKTMDEDTVIRNIRSKQQAEALIEAYKANRVTFLVFDGGEWFRVKGLAGAVPAGSVVIDMKQWTASAAGAEGVEIPFRASTTSDA